MKVSQETIERAWHIEDERRAAREASEAKMERREQEVNDILKSAEATKAQLDAQTTGLSPSVPQAQEVTPAPTITPETPQPSAPRVSSAGWSNNVNWSGSKPATLTATRRIRRSWGWAEESVDPRKMAQDNFTKAVQEQRAEENAKDKAKTKEVVEKNNAELKAKKDAKTAQRITIADSNLEVYRGLVAAYNQTILGDGSLDNQTTTKRGFVGKDQIDHINRAMRKSGNNAVTITGMMAVRGEGGLNFVVQGVRNKDGGKFEKVMSLGEVAQFGSRNMREIGRTDAEAEEAIAGDFYNTSLGREYIRRKEIIDPEFRKKRADVDIARAGHEETARKNKESETLAREKFEWEKGDADRKQKFEEQKFVEDKRREQEKGARSDKETKSRALAGQIEATRLRIKELRDALTALNGKEDKEDERKKLEKDLKIQESYFDDYSDELDGLWGVEISQVMEDSEGVLWAIYEENGKTVKRKIG